MKNATPSTTDVYWDQHSVVGWIMASVLLAYHLFILYILVVFLSVLLIKEIEEVVEVDCISHFP